MNRQKQYNKKQYATHRIAMCIVTMLTLLVSCSTKKNTPATRAYHALTAHYNTLYNGEVAYLEGTDAQYKSHKDNFNELLPMYICTNKTTAGMGKSNFETAITKCEKAIKVHSIKKRPVTKGNKKRTEKEKEFLARKEFNPYMYHAWLMMADAQFQKGEFFEAASTYNYILRLYSTQPDITSVAKARLARCYIALNWPYDAEDLLNKMKRDSITHKGQKEVENTKAAYYILTQQYNEAIPHLKNTIQSTRGKLPKARLNFLLAQLYHETGRDTLAYKALSKVIRANPPYEVAFNARIMQTEVMHKGKFRQMIARLKRMAKSDKNKDYLDKVYYAMGNIYLSNEDTIHCIYAWEKGLKESKKSGPDKATLLLHLSQLYWEQENYIDAARTYKQCVGALDKEHVEYKETERRSKVLSELEPHLSTIKLQDSLQVLAQSPEEVYLAAIDRVIAELLKKEKEEAKQAAANGTLNPNANNNAAAGGNAAGAAGKNNLATDLNSFGTQQQGDWYFYNPTTVRSGVQEFQKRWGKRPNEDFWRISNKQELLRSMGEDVEDYEYDEAAADSLFGAANSAAADSLIAADQARRDSLANDPHEREYYLKQIPFTEEQMAESNRLLGDALYNAGILEQEQLENFPLAERTMVRFLNDFPEHEGTDNIFYHLFLLYGRLNDVASAEEFRGYLLEDFPDAKLAALLGNPNYEMIARKGKHVEDSIYAEAYGAYQAEEYDKVEEHYQFSTENFPQGPHRARMMFIRAMSSLYGGERDTFMVTLRDVVQKFPKEEVSELASAIVKGLDEGRLLMDDRYDASSIWSRRARTESNDSTGAVPQLSDNRYSDFCFVLAYPTGGINENMLIFEMAHYNFTNYTARNFDIEIQADAGLSMMIIRGFLAYDEVHAYAQKLYADSRLRNRLEGIRTLLISDENLKMIGKEFSFDDYKEFYDKNFAPLEVPEDLRIDVPAGLEILDPDELDKREATEKSSEEGESVEDNDDFPFGF
ncbi:MAG: hypothetical protein UHJ41_05565 [Bacteroidaceae bacterium]|nr:hypothetical protein [Bacteroidaceae bacterium]